VIKSAEEARRQLVWPVLETDDVEQRRLAYLEWIETLPETFAEQARTYPPGLYWLNTFKRVVELLGFEQEEGACRVAILPLSDCIGLTDVPLAEMEHVSVLPLSSPEERRSGFCWENITDTASLARAIEQAANANKGDYT
jgi:hypothetical protein